MAFDDIRKAISPAMIFKYFDPILRTEIVCNASSVGVASILTQYSPDDIRHTVAYASRTLTDVEQRYSQLERECIAVVFGCEKYHCYVYAS